jgi:hypothetical protein
MAYLILDSSLFAVQIASISMGSVPMSLPCNAATAGYLSSCLFSTDSHLHLFIFITIHYISLHFSGLLFVKIAEFFKNSWLVGGLALQVQKIRQKTCGKLVKRWRNLRQGSGSEVWLGMQRPECSGRSGSLTTKEFRRLARAGRAGVA